MTRHSLIRTLPALIVCAALLDGCSWFHRDRVDYYKGAQETRPLEVPPDLDTPSSSKELVVPGAMPAAGSPAASSVSSVPPGAAPGETSIAGSDLHVADTLDNTYQRVGLALDRAQLGKVSSRDDAVHSYAFDFSSAVVTTPAEPQEHHWYTRVLHPFGGGKNEASTRQVSAALRVNVSEDAGGARVSVIGAPGDKSAELAAQRLLQALRERLS